MLIKFGGGVVDARGSIAGSTFSRNRSGAYARARVKPVNPNSDRQSDIRAIMSLTSAAYLDSASSVQRAEWGVFASNMPEKNKLGEDIRLSGFNQFVKTNVAARNAGLPMVVDGPTIFTKPGEDINFEASGSEATQQASIIFSDSSAWVDEDDSAMIIQIGIPQNASINFFDGPWRHAGIIRGNLASPPTSPATIALPYPSVEGQKLWVRGRLIFDDGRLGDWFHDSFDMGA